MIFIHLIDPAVPHIADTDAVPSEKHHRRRCPHTADPVVSGIITDSLIHPLAGLLQKLFHIIPAVSFFLLITLIKNICRQECSGLSAALAAHAVKYREGRHVLLPCLTLHNRCHTAVNLLQITAQHPIIIFVVFPDSSPAACICILNFIRHIHLLN